MSGPSAQKAVKLQASQNDEPSELLDAAQVNEIINACIDSFATFWTKQKELDGHPKSNLVYKFSGKFADWSCNVCKPKSCHRDRIAQFAKRRTMIKRFGVNDLRLLVWIVNSYANLHKISKITEMTQADWEAIAVMVPSATWQLCMLEILGLQRVNALEIKWTQQQSDILYQISQQIDDKHPHKWRRVSLELFLRNPSDTKVYRNRKQCYQHFWILSSSNTINYWSLEDDVRLLKGFLSNNHKKTWVREIRQILDQRKISTIRFRLWTLIKKQEEKEQQRGLTKTELAQAALEAIFASQPDLRNSFESMDLPNGDQKHSSVKLEQSILPVKLEDSENQGYANYYIPNEEASQDEHMVMEQEAEEEKPILSAEDGCS